jgi:hypothetical protein
MDSKKIKIEIIQAAEKAVQELIKIAKEGIIKEELDDSEISADRLKNAAATKKLAIFDAFEILSRIESETALLESEDSDKKEINSFAERRAK